MSATMQNSTMMQKGMRRGIAAALGLYMATFALPAMAETAKDAAPQDTATKTEQGTTQPEQSATKTLSVHGDWTVRCKEAEAEQGGGADGKICEAVQTLQTPDMKTILAHIAVNAQKDGPVYLVVQVPPRVWLPANVVLKVKGVEDIVLTYKHCGIACTASVKLSEAQLKALMASSGNGELVFEAGNRKSVLLPISFTGLPAAMEATPVE
ncbi:invasion associated locus B family protein [Xanthobacter sp. TB0139]|uniref:invasion associated locus B family protein n=1 Tax=Xanthobacter sp. TB0139 TaxID=3459178 RepID=UPI004039B060